MNYFSFNDLSPEPPGHQDPASREASVTSIKNLLQGLLDSISSHLNLRIQCSTSGACFFFFPDMKNGSLKVSKMKNHEESHL